MQKIKNNFFLAASLLLAIAIIFSSASFAVAKSGTSTEKNIKKQTGQVNAEEHRSAVANFVQTLLKVASSTEGGIGQEVRVIAQQQNNSGTTTAKAIGKIQSRNKIKTFLFGSDYKNLGALRSETVQTRNRIEKLNRVIQKATTTAEIQAQIKTLEQEQTKIENFIKESEGKFSLFGWLVKMLKE
ncbi:MAG: hypothetical protein PHR36_05305 [Patescibacteria group bacterium]|nr:hypothetical protein [Patescibacteria group bacterium]